MQILSKTMKAMVECKESMWVFSYNNSDVLYFTTISDYMALAKKEKIRQIEVSRKSIITIMRIYKHHPLTG